MNTETNLTRQLTETNEGMRVWQQERAIFEITERICELMSEKDVSRAELAKTLGTTRGYITQLLDGTANMTIRKISDIYLALGRQFHADDGPVCVENNSGPAVVKLFAYRQESNDMTEPVVQMDVHPLRFHQTA